MGADIAFSILCDCEYKHAERTVAFFIFPCKLYFKRETCKRVAHQVGLHYAIGLDIKKLGGEA